MQTIAMGLLIIVLDVPATGWDWIADPLGWVLILLGLSAIREVVPNHRGLAITAWVCLAVSVIIYPPDSVATLDDSLGWVFSLPTVVWCFLMTDSLHDVAEGGRRTTLLWLRHVFVLVGVLPLLVYLAGLDWLTVPAAVVAVAANIALLYLLWTGEEGDEPEEQAGSGGVTAFRARMAARTAEAAGKEPAPEKPAQAKGPKKGQDQGITGAEVVARVRKRRKSV